MPKTEEKTKKFRDENGFTTEEAAELKRRIQELRRDETSQAMVHAYPKIFLRKAQTTLGDAFDFAINTCGIPGEEFVQLFAASETGHRMANGDPAVVMGKSGIELAIDVVLETKGKSLPAESLDRFVRTREYWIGWAVAYYQWYSARSYMEIFEALPYKDLWNMYDPLHEADVSKFAEIADQRVREHFPVTNLKRIRTASGCTQENLAKESGVALRPIQMYEERQRNINKASAETLYRLAKTLGCAMESLIEK